MKKKLLYSLLTFGLTALIGVGAFVGLQNKTIKETKAIEVPKKYTHVTSNFESIIGSNHYYYAVAKNYEQNGEGVFYRNSITLDNSAIEGNYQCRLDLNATIIRNSNNEAVIFNAYTEQSGGVYHLARVSLYTLGSASEYIYYASEGIFNRDICAFVFTNLNYRNEESIGHLHLFTDYFDIFDLSVYAESYDFDKAFNFNNFYQVTDTFFAQPYNAVVGATTTTTGWEKTYNVGLFFSGGLMFDSIKVTFNRNNGYYFETAPSSREYKTYNVDALNASNYYFGKMEYINSATNFTITACNRTSYQQGSNSYIDFLPAWSNQGFKQLQFQNSINNLFNRSVFNSLSDTEQLNTPTYHADIGIGNAFSLIGQAFTAWIPILSVSVIPGITLGTLIFLPLIAGIIILIIWIVKR